MKLLNPQSCPMFSCVHPSTRKRQTNSSGAPAATGFIVPADGKDHTRQTVLDALKRLGLGYPEGTDVLRQGLQAMRKKLDS